MKPSDPRPSDQQRSDEEEKTQTRPTQKPTIWRSELERRIRAALKNIEAQRISKVFIERNTREQKASDAPSPSTKSNGKVMPIPDFPRAVAIPKGRALLLIALLSIILLNTIQAGATQFTGTQGWASTLGGPGSQGTGNLLRDIKDQLHAKPAPGQTKKISPQQYIDEIIHRMPLNMKLGQMMIVQFVGPDYSPDLSNMINQYNVGAVLIFTANQNVVSKPQLKGLIQQMQSNSTLPLAIAIDQEGGYVNRLVNLNGARPAEAEIGATNDPAKAKAAGMQDAQDLSDYGFNLNLAPVVDVDTNANSELHSDQRTYGTTAAQVTKMATAYLEGLQQSGKVIGTLKHFPGLGSVNLDPHIGVPLLTRTKSDLENIDWAPYRTMIAQGNVHAIMVTHEVVTAIDNTQPSTLSAKVVTGILRQEMGYQGVIMTDSLTMKGITDYVPEDQAPTLAVMAGSDLLMGASTPRDVAAMIEGLKQAIAAGTISEQRIDDSVRRILMLKYEMGLLALPNN